MKWALILMAVFASFGACAQSLPETVRFKSLDGQTELVGYLYAPSGTHKGAAPAVVMMHGRAGPYSSAADGRFDASTLSRRHVAWGEIWAEQGYFALLVDSFGPRGFAEGFPIHSHKDRPEAVNEVTVRPLDAYAALLYLRDRPDVDPRRIALQGWSNGGSATIATLSTDVFETPQIAAAGLGPQNGFQGGLALYPACGLHDKFVDGYRPYAPLRLMSGDADEEVSTERCASLVEASAGKGGDIAIKIYPGATHGFDDPNWKRQKIDANSQATDDAVPRAKDFVRALFASVNSQPEEPTSARAAPRGPPRHRENMDR